MYSTHKDEFMKKFWQLFCILIIVIIIAAFYSAIKKNATSGTKGYTLTKNESALLKFLLEDDAHNFAEGNETLLDYGAISVSAMTVAKAYSDNQVAADQKYYKKNLFLTGKIQSINSGLGNKPYIAFMGTNPFMLPQAHFNKVDINEIVSLKKGQKLKLVCEGNGAVAGIPMFDSCQFPGEYGLQKAAQTQKEIVGFLSGEKAASPLITELSVNLVALARSLPATSTCFTNGEKCINECNDIYTKNKDLIKQNKTAIISQLKSLGIQTPS